MAIDFPSSPSTGNRFLGSNGQYYTYDGSGWTTDFDALSPNPKSSDTFKYRSIYTRGYAAGGYKSSSAWTNVNRTQHSTDTTTNLGDILSASAAYCDGGFSDDYAWIWGGAFTSSTSCRTYGFATETGRTAGSGTSLIQTARYAMACLMNPGLTTIYITGGGSGRGSTDKFSCLTETMAASSPSSMSQSIYDHSACLYGKLYGYYRDTNGTSQFTWSTESWASYGGSFAASDGICKGLSTKDGFGYMRNGGNVVTASYYQINDTTGTIMNTAVNDPNGAGGEENHHTGQDKGYMLGSYNGSQNNNTFSLTYATNTMVAGGSTMQPKGHDGMSSGASASASAMLTGGL